MWYQLKSDQTATARTYVFIEGKSVLENGYTGTFTKGEITNGKIVFTPTFISGDSNDRYANSSLTIRTDFSKFKSLNIECYYDGAVSFTGKDEILVGYGNGSGTNFVVSESVTNTSKVTYTFNDLDGIAENGFIRVTYIRDPSNSTSSSFYITNIWFENANGNSSEPEPEDPETPTVQTFEVKFSGENVVFTGDETATNETDYVATISAADGYEISSVTATINGDVIGSYVDGVLTIPKENITGDIIIEAVTTVIVVEPDPVYYSVNTNLTNTTIEPDIEQIEAGQSYSATITADDEYELSSISAMMGGVDITNIDGCEVSLENGTIVIEAVNGNIVVTATATEVATQPTTLYLFDSTRSDNFLFGKYIYALNTGSITAESTTWPYSADTTNSPNQIVLSQKASGFLAPIGAQNEYLYLYPNNVEGNWSTVNGEVIHYSDDELFANNVTYEGKAAGTLAIDVGRSVTVHVNAYRTSTEPLLGEPPTISYVDSTGEITYEAINVTSSSKAEYTMTLSLERSGYFKFEAASNCGSLVITDIWIEYN